MNKIIATVIKEWILMRRDMGGLFLLLLMPAILIIIMAMVQDAPYKDYQELKFELLLADNDHGQLARQIIKDLKQSKNFHVTDSINGRPVTEEDIERLLMKGSYKIGVAIPNGVTAEVANSANIAVNSIAQTIGISAVQPTREVRKGIFIKLYFDPALKPAFKTSMSFALNQFITAASGTLLIQRMSALNSAKHDTGNAELFKTILQGIGIRETAIQGKNKPRLIINSVQHNVPAWTIFGMFLIVVPIAGHTIREREEGSSLRVALIPYAYNFVILGKIFFYTLVCILQFVCMFAIGKWALPFFGLPSLSPGLHPATLIAVAACVGFAATSFGYFVGAAFKTTNQAMPFGAITIVILSAIGGIWVPVEILPVMMQRLAMLSPLHWSLEAVDQILLRNGGINDIIMPLSILLCFGTVFWVISMILNKRRYQSIQ